jgi:hypothetical protein
VIGLLIRQEPFCDVIGKPLFIFGSPWPIIITTIRARGLHLEDLPCMSQLFRREIGTGTHVPIRLKRSACVSNVTRTDPNDDIENVKYEMRRVTNATEPKSWEPKCAELYARA